MKKIFLYVMIALMPAMVTVSESAATKYTLNADPSLPFFFFDGRLRIAEFKEAEAKDRQARLAYDDLKKNGEIELRASWFGLKTLKGLLKFLEDQQIFPKDNYNAVLKLFENGLAASLDVMDANPLLLTSDKNLPETSYNDQLSYLKVKRSSGMLL